METITIETSDHKSIPYSKKLLLIRSGLAIEYFSDNPKINVIPLSMTEIIFTSLMSLLDGDKDIFIEIRKKREDVIALLLGADRLMLTSYTSQLIISLIKDYFDKEKIPYFQGLIFRDYAKKLEDTTFLSNEEKNYLKTLKMYRGETDPDINSRYLHNINQYPIYDSDSREMPRVLEFLTPVLSSSQGKNNYIPAFVSDDED